MDATNVPLTCPFIDDVIEVLQGCKEETKNEMLKGEISKAFNTMEEIREHNSSLREKALYYQDIWKEADSTIDDLKWEISELKQKILDLEFQIETTARRLT